MSLVVLACQKHEQPVHTRPASTLGLRRYMGDGFSFDYPADASFRPGRNFPEASVDLYILGPNLTVRADSGSRTRGYSVYSLELVAFPNPVGATALEWAKGKFSPAHPDTSEAGCGDAPRFLDVTIAGLQGVQVNTIGCDGDGTDYYVTDGRIVVGFRTYESDDELLQPLQNPFYALVLSTFRWNQPTH